MTGVQTCALPIYLHTSVLLIDADLRKSVLLGRVEVDGEVLGLTHYLSKQAKLADVICATSQPKFHIIFSGIVPPNPAELLVLLKDRTGL